MKSLGSALIIAILVVGGSYPSHPASAEEFQAAPGAFVTAGQPRPTLLTQLPSRFNRIDIVLLIITLLGDDSYRGPRSDYDSSDFRRVSTYVAEYVAKYLLPALTDQGFAVRYLGSRDAVPQSEGQAILVIDYAEYKGARFQWNWTGVNIHCNLSVNHPATGASLYERDIIAGNSHTVSIALGFHRDAHRNLENEFKVLRIDLSKWAAGQ